MQWVRLPSCPPCNKCSKRITFYGKKSDGVRFSFRSGDRQTSSSIFVVTLIYVAIA